MRKNLLALKTKFRSHLENGIGLLFLLLIVYPNKSFTQTSISCPIPVTTCLAAHTTTVDVDAINGCLTNDIEGDIQQMQSDCRDLQNTTGSCHKFVISRGINSIVTGVSFDFGQGAGCNGDVDAGYVQIGANCFDLGTGGSQSATSFLGFPPGINTIELTICKASSSFYTLCGFCACQLTLDCNSTSVSCNSNGSVTAIATNSVGTVTYTLNPGGITNTNGIFTNLSAGIYTVVAVDANNCQGECTVTVIQDMTDPTCSATGGNIDCISGLVQLMSATNVTNASFSWNGPGGFTSTQQNPFVTVAGTYSVTITNIDNSCTSSCNADVTADVCCDLMVMCGTGAVDRGRAGAAPGSAASRCPVSPGQRAMAWCGPCGWSHGRARYTGPPYRLPYVLLRFRPGP